VDFLALDEQTGPVLTPAELHARYDHVLETAIRLVRQIPDDRLEDQLPHRPRSYLMLMHHIFQIPTAYLDTEDTSGTLTYESLARISHTGWDLRGDRGSYTLTLWR
jgi:hypothetical protein